MLSAPGCRPGPATADLHALIEPTFKAGLLHKLFAGRPYEEVADLLDDQHYARCAAASRPASSTGFSPAAAPPLAASTRVGPGYNREEALQAIRERYELVNGTLRYTLPRLLGEGVGRAMIIRLREAGWLDWQILVALSNAAWNWRMLNAGIQPGFGDPREQMRLARVPETEESPRPPLTVFSEEALATHTLLLTAAVAQRWDLHGRQENPGEEAMRDLLIRRYLFGKDDVPHRDLLDCVDQDGHFRPL